MVLSTSGIGDESSDTADPENRGQKRRYGRHRGYGTKAVIRTTSGVRVKSGITADTGDNLGSRLHSYHLAGFGVLLEDVLEQGSVIRKSLPGL